MKRKRVLIRRGAALQSGGNTIPGNRLNPGFGISLQGLGLRAYHAIAVLGAERRGMQPASGALLQAFGFWVSGSGCRVQGFGIRVSGSRFRVWGSGFRVPSAGFRGSNFGIGFLGFGFWFPVFGFRVSGLRGERRALEVHETRREPAVRGWGLRVRVLVPGLGFGVWGFGFRV